MLNLQEIVNGTLYSTLMLRLYCIHVYIACSMHVCHVIRFKYTNKYVAMHTI